MTDAELIALLRAELDVAMNALRIAERLLFPGQSVHREEETWRSVQCALADIERMEVEAGRKVVGNWG